MVQWGRQICEKVITVCDEDYIKAFNKCEPSVIEIKKLEEKKSLRLSVEP